MANERTPKETSEDPERNDTVNRSDEEEFEDIEDADADDVDDEEPGMEGE